MQDAAKHTVLTLTSLEIFFIVTTILSLFLNLYQLMTARKYRASFHTPLSNGLIALFNDIKQKSLNAFLTQQRLFNIQNPHKEIGTLKWDYVQFAQSMMDNLRGFQESVVGLIVTLNPQDKEGKMAFRASGYGLTEEEKELNRDRAKHWIEQAKISAKKTETI